MDIFVKRNTELILFVADCSGCYRFRCKYFLQRYVLEIVLTILLAACGNYIDEKTFLG